MSWHCTEPHTFHSEAKRVLKPGGCIAVYGYNITISDNKKVGTLFEAIKKELIQNDCMDDRIFLTLN